MPSYPRIRRNPILTLRPFPEKTSRQSTSLAPAQKATGWISLGVWIMQCPMWEKARSGGGPRHMYFSCMVIWMNLIYSSQTGVFQFKGPFKIFTAICTFHNVLSGFKKNMATYLKLLEPQLQDVLHGGRQSQKTKKCGAGVFWTFFMIFSKFLGISEHASLHTPIHSFVGVCFGGVCSSLISKFGGPS